MYIFLDNKVINYCKGCPIKTLYKTHKKHCILVYSVTLTVGIGLAIDTTLHYAVAFRLQQPSSPNEDAASQRKITVTSTVTTMAPAVTLATFTTALAGLMMTPASILAYVQLGIFLVVIMMTSWIFSTFFFLSLLRYLGTVHKPTQPWRSTLCVRF